MPLYDLMYIVKPFVRRRELADILMRTGRYVFANGGVVTKVESFGCRDLAYDFKVQGETFDEVRPRASPSRRISVLANPATCMCTRGLERVAGLSESDQSVRMRTELPHCNRLMPPTWVGAVLACGARLFSVHLPRPGFHHPLVYYTLPRSPRGRVVGSAVDASQPWRETLQR